MFFKKEGRPEPKELVVCTVKKILPHAAFVILDEYNNLEAMLHVSEISSKWIKNIKDHVSEGKRIVCKVLEIKHQGHIDVSLKRVTSSETKRKLDELKSEQRMEKLIEAIAKKMNEDPKTSLEKIGGIIINEFESLADFSSEIKKEGAEFIKELDLPKNWKDEIYTQISEQLKSQRVKLCREIEVQCFEDDGTKRLQTFFDHISSSGKDKDIVIEVKFVSAPKYRLDISAKNYKDGEAFIEELTEKLEEIAPKQKIEFTMLGEC